MLKWIGDKKGIEGIFSIPARDLTDDEVIRFGGEQSLLDTGLYEKPAQAKVSKAAEKEGE